MDGLRERIAGRPVRTTLTILLASIAIPVAGNQAPPSPRPSPKPPPPPVIEGTVKGPGAKPVEGALVVAAAPLSWGRESPLSTRTDAQGRFHIRARRYEPHMVSVQARGLAIARLERIQPGTPLSVTLQKGGAIEGVVRDGEGRPVRGARVRASASSAVSSLAWEPEAGVVTAVSDARGRYRLEGLGPGLHEVTATALGLGRGRRTNARAGTAIDLTLVPGGWISGVVVGPDGKPAPGALVRADVATRPYSASRAEVADEAGRFAVVGLDPGEYAVVAWRKDLAPGLTSGVRVEPEAETPTEVLLAPGARLTARLIGAAEQPVDGRVYVQDLEGGPVPYSLLELLRAEAGPDGRFAIERAPPGSLTLAILGRGHAPRRLEARVGPRDSSVDLGEIVLEVGLAITGRVRNQAGTAVPEARVAAWRRGPTISAAPGPDETFSEADGRFTLAGLEPGIHNVNARAPGYAPASKNAEAGAEGVELVMTPGGVITGLVMDERDRPIESYTVGWETREERRSGMTRTSSADGRFTLEDMNEGTYAIRIDAPEAAAGSVSNIKVTAGQTSDAGTIRLGRGGVVRGTVTDAAGGPVATASISLRAATPMWTGVPLQAESDGAGAFEIKGAPAGKVTLSTRHPGYAAAFATLDVDPAKEPTVAHVVLTQGGRIEGWARRRDGSALADVSVHVRPILGPERPYDSGIAPVTPLADGSFVVDHVPAGRAFVSLMAGATGPAASIQGREVEIREGQTTAVEFSVRDILVSGRVTRGGAPLAGVRVTIRTRFSSGIYWGGPRRLAAPPSGLQRLTAMTAEDGSYELIASEPGKTTVSVEAPDGRHFPLREIEIPDADTFALDLSYAGLTLGGIVVDKESGQPLPESYVSALPRKKDGRASWGTSGADGRFTLEIEPGEYRLQVRNEKHAPFTSELAVEETGAPDLRVELARGLVLEGRVVDETGRPMAGFQVTATAADSTVDPPDITAGAHTLPDGAFRMEGLLAKAYTLATGSAAAGFAVRNDVTPETPDVVLRLRPGGRVRVTVVGADGAPIHQAYARVRKLDGVPIVVPVFGTPPSDAAGVAEVPSPAGTVEITAGKGRLTGRAAARVPVGGIAEARIVVKEEPPER